MTCSGAVVRVWTVNGTLLAMQSTSNFTDVITSVAISQVVCASLRLLTYSHTLISPSPRRARSSPLGTGMARSCCGSASLRQNQQVSVIMQLPWLKLTGPLVATRLLAPPRPHAQVQGPLRPTSSARYHRPRLPTSGALCRRRPGKSLGLGPARDGAVPPGLDRRRRVHVVLRQVRRAGGAPAVLILRGHLLLVSLAS